MRKTSELHVGSCAVFSFGKYNAKNSARFDGVLTECFVEITDPEEQHGFGVARLDLIVLLHQGRFGTFFCALL
jgi:hypothetical protein